MPEQEVDEKYEDLRKEIAVLLKKYTEENENDQLIYTDFMLGCLNVYRNTVRELEEYKKPATHMCKKDGCQTQMSKGAPEYCPEHNDLN